MSMELTQRTAGVQITSMDDLTRVAEMMANSGFFADAREAAQAGVKIMAGQAWGIDPFNAMTGIHIIKNRPTISAGLMAAAVKQAGSTTFGCDRSMERSARLSSFSATKVLA